MITKFTRKLELSASENPLAVLKDLFVEENAKAVTIVDDYKLEFETKGVFSYANFTLFSMVDYGEIIIEQKDCPKALVTYKVVSWRVWLLILVAGIGAYTQFGRFDYSAIFMVLVLLINWVFNYMAHYFFFRRIAKLLKAN